MSAFDDRARRVLAIGSLMLTGLAMGCGGDFDPNSRITSLRLIAMSASKPYAKPGDKVTFEALWFDPLDEKRPRQWAWLTCVNPASSSVLGCLTKIALDIQRTGKPPVAIIGPDIDVFSVTIPEDTLSSLPKEARRSALVAAVVIACPGEIRLPAASALNPGGGISDAKLPIECVENRGTPQERSLRLDEFEIGIKRVFVRATDTNSNPTIESVTWAGKPWPETEVKEVTACDDNPNRFDDCSAENHAISLNVTKASFEKGTDEFGSSFEEDMIVQYYATEGLFEFDVKRAVSPGTKFVARKNARGKTLTMWLVARDDRGGQSWAIRKVKVN